MSLRLGPPPPLVSDYCYYFSFVRNSRAGSANDATSLASRVIFISEEKRRDKERKSFFLPSSPLFSLLSRSISPMPRLFERPRVQLRSTNRSDPFRRHEWSAEACSTELSSVRAAKSDVMPSISRLIRLIRCTKTLCPVSPFDDPISSLRLYPIEPEAVASIKISLIFSILCSKL